MTRILVVDDEPSILAAVVPLLRARGYEVYSATSGQTALDAVDRHAPELVILDLGLPDMEGAEVCRRIREGRSVPIIVLSARNAESDKVAALDAGADDYVTKPFGPEELLARLRAALRRAEPGTMAAGPIERGDIRSTWTCTGSRVEGRKSASPRRSSTCWCSSPTTRAAC